MNKDFKSIYRSYFINEIADNDVIGLVEPINIDMIGEIDAKVDSGNGAFNVLHGDILSKRGKNIIINTVNNKKLKKEVVDTVILCNGDSVYDYKKIPSDINVIDPWRIL